MPAKTDFLKDLPDFYKHQTYHAVLFGFIRCWKRIYPSATTIEIAGAFKKEFPSSEQLDLIGLTIAYSRTNKDFFNAERKEHKEKAEKETSEKSQG